VGAAQDTIIGGSGDNDVINAIAGPELVFQGTGANGAVYGAKGDSIRAATSGATSTSSAQIVASAGSMSVQINAAGNYTIASGTGDTITAAAGAANAVVAGAASDRIDLTGNTGNSTVVAFGGNEAVTLGSG